MILSVVEVYFMLKKKRFSPRTKLNRIQEFELCRYCNGTLVHIFVCLHSIEMGSCFSCDTLVMNVYVMNLSFYRKKLQVSIVIFATLEQKMFSRYLFMASVNRRCFFWN